MPKLIPLLFLKTSKQAYESDQIPTLNLLKKASK